MKIPIWLTRVLDDQGAEKIATAVRQAEQRTSAEIVPMIVRRSVTIGHVPLLLFLIHILVLLLLLPVLVSGWSQIPYWGLELGVFIVAGVLAWLQSGWSFWHRYLTAPEDRELSARRRAELEFYESNIKQTSASTGVLIFVSLLEHQAVILADKAVAERFSKDIWREILDQLLASIKAGNFTAGMEKAIADVGRLLEKEFPVHPGDRNELPDPLVIKE